MDYGALPPEINSGRMYAGPGAGSMLAAAAAWDGLAAELESAASSYGSVISALTGGPWVGPSSTAMAAAAAPYVAWMGATAGQAELAAAQAQTAAGAYAAAFAATVPPPEIAANRALLMTLIATNIFGQNTPAIAATEAQYAEMWAQDAAAMYGYAATSAAATAQVTPFTAAPQTTDLAGLAAQGAASAQSAGSSVSTGVQSALSQLTSAITGALQNLASPLSSLLSGSSSSTSSTILGPAGGLLSTSGLSLGGIVSGVITEYAAIPGWAGLSLTSDRARAPSGHKHEYGSAVSSAGVRGRGGGGGGSRSGCAGVRVRRGLRRSSRLGRFGGDRSSGLGRGVVGAAELGLGRDGPGRAGGGGSAADTVSCGCAVGGQRCCRRRFPSPIRRARAGRSGGRWNRRGRCCSQIRVTP